MEMTHDRDTVRGELESKFSRMDSEEVGFGEGTGGLGKGDVS